MVRNHQIYQIATLDAVTVGVLLHLGERLFRFGRSDGAPDPSTLRAIALPSRARP